MNKDRRCEMSYLKRYREKKNLTQKQMAVLLGYSYSHYVKIEDSFSEPSVKFLRSLKTAFPDIDMNEMIKKSLSSNQ